MTERETSSLFGPLVKDRRAMVYNEHGDLIEEISENEQTGFTIDDDGDDHAEHHDSIGG
jgi:hypothetical protein